MAVQTEDGERVRALLTFYREAHYDVRDDAGELHTLRVGEPMPTALEKWLGAATTCAYLTACNPHSQPLSPAQNARRMQQLLVELDAASLRYLRGDGHMPGESWREPSVLVAGLPLSELDALVRRHEQNAILIGACSEPMRLRLYRDDWRFFAAPTFDLEWA